MSAVVVRQGAQETGAYAAAQAMEVLTVGAFSLTGVRCVCMMHALQRGLEARRAEALNES